jgi:hypothetical protein
MEEAMQCYVTFTPYSHAALAKTLPTDFVNEKLKHECVEFVRQTTGAPSTPNWRPGAQVKGTAGIPAGAAIANFNGINYLSHAAIYLSQDDAGIWVLDQWNAQGHVAKRQIFYPKNGVVRANSDNGDLFYVIDPVRTNAEAKNKGEPLHGFVIST